MSPARILEEDESEIRELIQAVERLGVTVLFDEPMARHCTLKIGGPADLYAVANDIDALERLGNLAAEHSLPLTILGGGSNVLISDLGIRGLVVANQARVHVISSGPDQAEIWDELDSNMDDASSGPHTGEALLVVDSGAALAGLARWAIREGWSGLEWAVSVPGTVGGAVIGNAGAHGGQISDNLEWVLVAHPGRGHETMTVDQMQFGYRDSILKRILAAGAPSPIILQVGFRVLRGEVAEMTARADAYLAKRRTSQPVEPSAGSVFRNPPGDYAGRLIEAAGLKGHSIGGAQVSTRHANFIINTGNARAAEVAELMRLVRSRVLETTGIALVPEILYMGDWSEVR
jgi:UDP-N-acetylmuramate dehydrogenase